MELEVAGKPSVVDPPPETPHGLTELSEKKSLTGKKEDMMDLQVVDMFDKDLTSLDDPADAVIDSLGKKKSTGSMIEVEVVHKPNNDEPVEPEELIDPLEKPSSVRENEEGMDLEMVDIVDKEHGSEPEAVNDPSEESNSSGEKEIVEKPVVDDPVESESLIDPLEKPISISSKEDVMELEDSTQTGDTDLEHIDPFKKPTSSENKDDFSLEETKKSKSDDPDTLSVSPKKPNPVGEKEDDMELVEGNRPNADDPIDSSKTQTSAEDKDMEKELLLISDEVINLSGDESDEGSGVGAIRIRDFGSIKEISEDEEEDDDVVEIPHVSISTIRVRLEDEPESSTDIHLDCGEESSSVPQNRGSAMKKFLEGRKKLLSLQSYIRESQMPNGLRVVNGSEMLQNVSHVMSNQGRLMSTGRGYSAVPRQGLTSTLPGNYRLSSGRTPISVVRGRPVNVVTTQNGGGKAVGTILNSSGKPMNMVNMNNVGGMQSLTQLIFDPATGLLLCPSPGGGTTMQALRPSMQALQSIQTASQIACSRLNAPGPVQMPRFSVTRTPTTSVSSDYMQSRRGRALPVRIIAPATVGGSRTYLPISPATRPFTPISSVVSSSVRTIRMPTVPAAASPRPSSIGNTPVRLYTNQRTTPAYKPKEPYVRPAVAPPASAALKLLNQQSKAAAAAVTASAIAKNSMTETEEVTAGSLQAIAAPDKDPHNSKTFPSLVVNVKPCLQDKLNKTQQQGARSDLDARVKTILMYTPSKFTEWMMQKGLLRVDHRCTIHTVAVPYKLGMYSDGANKQPFSGGYVWISDCCSDKQISVFQGSIFEASIYPPGTLMKLIYHWSCQTPAANVLQWVKVTSYYLKNFYTLLRSACVAGLHENCPKMGGQGKYIEIGIITLGTTVASHAGQQKQVKIEILGVFDPASKSIRMKVINPQNVGVTDINNERISQILWPLNHWVDKQSVILIDTSMDKTLLEEMGFSQVNQSKGGIQNQAQKSATPTNVNVMNYLKNVVPKMFQNTLCVLSKSLIQQFLDELSWREIWGANPTTAFDTIVAHLVQMTKADTGETLISRLNKISLNPFSEWSFGNKPASGIECLPESIRGGSDIMGTSTTLSDFPSIDGLGELAANYMRNRTTGQSPSTFNASAQPKPQTYQQNGITGAFKRKFDSTPVASELSKHLMASSSKIFTLQTYYYIWSQRALVSRSIRGDFPQNLKCPLCSKLFVSNHDAMRHIIIHVVNVGRSSATQAVCNYCLKELSPANQLATHINESHKLVDIPYCCRICNEKFSNENSLVLHMWQHHVECESPYHCEVCDFRSSYHYEVVDHFHKEHAGLDCVQCPLCLRVMGTKSFACLKILVVHLQNHMIKKGKKCPDCCLVFVNDQDYRSHVVNDKAHESRANMDFKRHKLLGEPIGMAKPPAVGRAKLPPPVKKPRTSHGDGSRKSAAGPSVTTLNSELAIPINPSEKFAHDRFPVLVMGLEKGKHMCWECDREMTIAFHYTGMMKCTKCKYYTHCPAAMTRHSKLHGPVLTPVKFGPQLPKPMKGDEDLCCGCGFRSFYPDKLAVHLLMCDQKIAYPFKEDDEDGEDEGPPVLLQQQELQS